MPHILLNHYPIQINDIFCIARSYAQNEQELQITPRSDPIVFLKPKSALHFDEEPVLLPHFAHNVHYETELVVLLNKGGRNLSTSEALACIGGYGIGLDLTEKDWQSSAREKGLPWTQSKGFEGAACLVRQFLPVEAFPNSQQITFDMYLNGKLQQHGDTSLLLYSLAEMISYLSQYFMLNAGDLIYTGTPSGTGPLHHNDKLVLQLGKLRGEFTIQYAMAD